MIKNWLKYLLKLKIYPYFFRVIYILFVNGKTGNKSKILKKLGSNISRNCILKGKIDLYNPFLLEVKKNCQVHNIINKKDNFLFIDRNTRIKNVFVKKNTIIADNKILFGRRIKNQYLTLSIDLEGGVGLAHANKKEFKKLRRMWNSKRPAQHLAKILIKHNLPCTWAICGHLFLEQCNGNHGFEEQDWYGDWFKYDPRDNYKNDKEWYMPDFIKTLSKNTLFEIAYHSFGHFNYNQALSSTIKKDLLLAEQIRKKYKLSLSSIVYPYNDIAHVSSVVKGKFKNLRGYIAKGNVNGIYDFDKFNLFCTSYFVSPKNVKKLTKHINKIVQKENTNFFTHAFNWQTFEDFKLFEEFIIALKKTNKKIIRFCDLK